MGQAPVNGMGSSGVVDAFRAVQDARAARAQSQSPVNGWTQEELDRLENYSKAIREMPDFEGKNALYNTARSQMMQLIEMQRNQPKIDLSGYSEVADQYNSQRQRLQDEMSAGGFGGSGVMAGAMANLSGSQARAQGGFVRDALEQRRREKMAQDWAFLNNTFGMQRQGLDRVYAKEDEPGFWEDALGVLGGVAGTALGGPVGGAIGAGVGGLFSKNSSPNAGGISPTQQIPYGTEAEPWWGMNQYGQSF
jgi:hypothetical protein